MGFEKAILPMTSVSALVLAVWVGSRLVTGSQAHSLVGAGRAPASMSASRKAVHSEIAMAESARNTANAAKTAASETARTMGPVRRALKAVPQGEDWDEEAVLAVAQIPGSDSQAAVREMKDWILKDQSQSPLIGFELRLVLSGLIRASSRWPIDSRLSLLSVLDQASVSSDEYLGVALSYSARLGLRDLKRVQQAWRKLESYKSMKSPPPETETMSLLEGLRLSEAEPNEAQLRILLSHGVYGARRAAAVWICERLETAHQNQDGKSRNRLSEALSTELSLMKATLASAPVQARALAYQCLQKNWNWLKEISFLKPEDFQCSVDDSVSPQFGELCRDAQKKFTFLEKS